MSHISAKFDGSDKVLFIASHFYEMDFESIASLELCELEQVLSHESLRLRDENSLVDTIDKLCEIDDEYCSLFRQVEIGYVDLDRLNTYLCRVYPDHLDYGIWENVCWRLREFDPELRMMAHETNRERFLTLVCCLLMMSHSKELLRNLAKNVAEIFIKKAL